MKRKGRRRDDSPSSRTTFPSPSWRSLSRGVWKRGRGQGGCCLELGKRGVLLSQEKRECCFWGKELLSLGKRRVVERGGGGSVIVVVVEKEEKLLLVRSVLTHSLKRRVGGEMF